MSFQINDDLVDQAPSFPNFEFMNMLNNSEETLNLDFTVEDLMNPEQDETERKRHIGLSKRRMPYIENNN